jgi:hypothetical protein
MTIHAVSPLKTGKRWSNDKEKKRISFYAMTSIVRPKLYEPPSFLGLYCRLSGSLVPGYRRLRTPKRLFAYAQKIIRVYANDYSRTPKRRDLNG